MSYTIHPYGDKPISGHAFPLLYNLVHRSRASAGVDDAAVDRMIESVRRGNPAQGHLGAACFGSVERMWKDLSR